MGRHFRMYRCLSTASIVLVVIALVISVTIKPGRAVQNSHALQYDWEENGTISDVNFEDRWTLAAPGQDLISIHLERDPRSVSPPSQTLIPEVRLEDAEGHVIAQATHDPDTYDKAVIKSFVLPAAGNYTVVASRYQGQTGKTQGNYLLYVTLLGAGTDRLVLIPGLTVRPTPQPSNMSYLNGPALDDTTIVELGDAPIPVIGTIRNEAWARLFLLSAYSLTQQDHTFTIPGPFRLHVTAYRLNGDLLPTLSLIPIKVESIESGNPLIYHSPKLSDLPTPIAFATVEPSPQQPVQLDNFHLSTSTITELEADVQQTGEYAVLVSRQDGQQGTTYGQFTLGLNGYGVPINSPGLFKRIASDTTNLEIGTPQKYSIQAFGGSAVYTLTVGAPQTVSVTVQRTSFTLVPHIAIYTSDGVELASADADPDTLTTATISKTQLPMAGPYIIVVSGRGEQFGKTAGDFTITVSAVTP